MDALLRLDASMFHTIAWTGYDACLWKRLARNTEFDEACLCWHRHRQSVPWQLNLAW